MKKKLAIIKKLFFQLFQLSLLTEMTASMYYEQLKQDSKYRDPRSLVAYGYKMYSQNDEDGMIREIFKRIGTTNKLFVEFGVGNGLENNTLALLFEGWRGLWIEGDSRFAEAMRNGFKKILASGRLMLAQSFITKENINGLIAARISEKEIDLLSVDIDGNDYEVLKAITTISPRVIVIEYNAKFVPPLVWSMGYNETHAWKEDDNMGASLKFLELKLKDKGYSLVGCNLSGSNAFFVKSELAGDRFLTPYTAEQHYETARYYLSRGMRGGSAPSYEALDNGVFF